MSRDAERLLAEVLKLPVSERAELVRKTMASIEDASMTPTSITGPLEWPGLVASSVSVEESARAIEDGRL